MSEILNKISSYNIFNYLFSGTIFAVAADAFTSYSLIQEDILIAIFLYYFLGMVISRVGSLAVEPLLKKTGFIRFSDYSKFVIASQTDPKIEVLSEVNNVYRTLCALFVTLLIFSTYDACTSSWPFLTVAGPYVAASGLLVMFLFSYRKQTNYIVKRINIAGDE